jgi:hypothetical protein
VATLYASKMKYARSSEQVSHAFVDSAVTVYRRVLSVQDACKWLEWCEENMMGQSPWAKSIYALQALVDRAQGADRIGWAVWGLTDLYRMELVNLGDFTVSKLKDYRQSYIEVLNLKHALRGHLLHQWLPSLGFASHVVAKLQEVFADFGSVRVHVTGYPHQAHADTTWMVGLAESARAAVDVIEDMVYTVQWDPRFKDATRSKVKIADFLEYESVRAAMDHVKDVLTHECSLAAAAATLAAQGDAGGSTTAAPAGADAPPAVTTGFTSMSIQDQTHWDHYVDKQFRTYVELIPESKSALELEHAIRESTLANLRGDPTGLVLYYFDVKMTGEPATRPEVRIAPFRDAMYHRMVRAVVSARCPVGSPATLRTGEVAVLLDGGRHGNAAKLLAPWREGTLKDVKKEEDGDEAEIQDGDDDDDDSKPGFVTNTLNIIYTEDSIQARRRKARGGTASVHQNEWAHMLSHARVSLPERQRKHFPGSTSGDTIYGVGKPELGTEWTVPWKDKKEMYGKKNLIPVGGKTEGADPDDPPAERKTDATEVPFVYHGMPAVWYEELIHTFFVKAIVDLTPGDAKFAWQALINRIGYVGIVFTPAHGAAITKRLKDQIKEEMIKPGSRMFNAQYARAAGVETTAASGDAGGGGGQLPRRASTQRRRGAPKAASARAASGGNGGAGGGGAPPAAGGGEGAGGGDGTGAGDASPTFAEGDDDVAEEGIWDPLGDQ